MQVLEGQDDLDCEKDGYIVGKPALSSKQCEKLTTASIVQEHEDVGRRLESALQVDNEWVVDPREDALLTFDVIDLLETNYFTLF